MSSPPKNFTEELNELKDMMSSMEKQVISNPSANEAQLQREQLESQFHKLDKFRNGWLNFDEFQRLLEVTFKGIVLVPEQRDRCFIYCNKSETGKVTLDEVLENVPTLPQVDFRPEISPEMLELIQSQGGQAPNDDELLQVGWEVIGTIIDGDEDPRDLYDLVEEVGKGTFSTVHRCVEKATGKMMALKIIDIAAAGDDIYDLQHEITVQMGCHDPHICKYYKSYIRGNELWVFLEFLGGGSLSELMKPGPFPEAEIRVIIREIARGLLYLHCRGFIHRDIKPDNVRISESGEVKLTDFRVSTTLAQMHSTFAGTPLYISPEMVLENVYNQKVDIWSLGITCIELATGLPPNHDLEVIQAITKIPVDPAPTLQGDFSDTFKEFVAYCLNKNPEYRPSSMEILSHPFLCYQQQEPSLFRLIERKKGAATGDTMVKLIRFRSVRRDKAPIGESAQMMKSNLSRKPTGVKGDTSAKIRERKEKKEREKKKKERESRRDKPKDLEKEKEKEREKGKEKKKKVKIQI